MKKIKVLVYDTNQGYRERFLDYLLCYKAKEMEFSVFTEAQLLLDSLEQHIWQLAVLGEGCEQILSDLKSKKIPTLILTETGSSYVKDAAEAEDPVMYTSRYQPMDVIIKHMHMLAKGECVQGDVRWMTKQIEVIGVISPIKHEMQMLFSLLYAKNAAKREKVLYLNLLEYAGFREIVKTLGASETAGVVKISGKVKAIEVAGADFAEADFADVVLQLREDVPYPEKVLDGICEWEGFSYISPVLNPQQLGEITAEDMEKLVRFVAEYTDFQTIILDIGLSVLELPEILSKCAKIYCIGRRGYFFEIQMRQFFSYLEQVMEEMLLQNIVQLELPYHPKAVCGGRQLLEQLDWSEFGDMVRGVISGERRSTGDS